MTKNAERREKFKRIGAAIGKIGNPNIGDYHTGRASSFSMKRFDQKNRDSEDPLNKAQDDRTEVPFGPRFNTPQWERTLRK